MNTKMQTKKAKRGFTITELVIVIAVIAILAAVLIPTFSNVINRANESAAMQEAKSEFDNFMPEIALSEEENVGDDFLFVYTKGNTTMNFAVVNGQFNTDPVGESFTVGENTYTKSDKKVGVSGGVYADYEIQNDNITIFVLDETPA